MSSIFQTLWSNLNRILITILVLVISYFAYQRLFGAPFNPMAGFGGPMPVTVATVEAAEYQPEYHFTGRFTAVNEAVIRPQVEGTIQAIHFTEGQMVKAGDKLFSINPATFQTAAAQAEAALTQAKAAFERGEKLRAQDAISAADMESRSSAYRAAQAAYTQARQKLNDALVRAPISGRVGRPEITVGNPVSAGNGAPILTTIQSISPMYVDFDASEQTYLQLLEQNLAAGKSLIGADVAVGLATAGDDFPLQAKLTAVDNRLTNGTGSLRLRATLENSDGTLLPGLFARVKLTVPVSLSTVLVNDAAIVTDQASRMVWKIDANATAASPTIPQPQKIEIGALSNGLRVVNSGLKAGDRIVVNGLMRVRPGAQVIPMEGDMQTLQPKQPPQGQTSTTPQGN